MSGNTERLTNNWFVVLRFWVLLLYFYFSFHFVSLFLPLLKEELFQKRTKQANYSANYGSGSDCLYCFFLSGRQTSHKKRAQE